MGIDAEILLRVKGPKPTDSQIAIWGDQLCRAIGARHFSIRDGLPPEEYAAASEQWHARFKAHPLYPKYCAGEREAHAQLLDELGPAPEQRQRAIELTNYLWPIDEHDDGIPPEYCEPGKCWLQDGDPIFAQPGEWFLEVSVWSRYYGIGYERGDLLTLCAIAEWCEQSIPGCAVWYGGDSSGVCAAPWPESERRKLRLHLYSASGRDYYSHFGGGGPRPAPCGLCIGKGRFNEFGWGPNYIAVSCASCGKRFESRDHGASWQEEGGPL